MNFIEMILNNEDLTDEEYLSALAQLDTIEKLTEAIKAGEEANIFYGFIDDLERKRDEIIVLDTMKDFKVEDLDLYFHALDEIDLLEVKLKEARLKDDVKRISELEKQIELLGIYTNEEYLNEEYHNEMCYNAGIDLDDEPYHSTCLFDFLARTLRQEYFSR